MKNRSVNIQSNSTSTFSSERRDFLKSSTLLVSAMILSSWSFVNSATPQTKATWPEMAYNFFTPLFVLQNTGRLALGSAFIHGGLKHCLTTDVRSILPGNSFMMGALMPFKGEDLLPVLETLKSDFNQGSMDQAMAQKMALIIGALCYQSAIKPLKNSQSGAGNPECQVYQDAEVIRNYFSKGVPFEQKDQANIKKLIGEMVPRTFIRFHTVMPDDDDGAAWVLNTARWREQTEGYIGELSGALVAPDPEKRKKYIQDLGFMSANDLILKKISVFAKVSEISRQQAERLVTTGQVGSVLARSVAASYGMVMDVNDYIGGKILRSELKSKINER